MTRVGVLLTCVVTTYDVGLHVRLHTLERGQMRCKVAVGVLVLAVRAQQVQEACLCASEMQRGARVIGQHV